MRRGLQNWPRGCKGAPQQGREVNSRQEEERSLEELGPIFEIIGSKTYHHSKTTELQRGDMEKQTENDICTQKWRDP